MWGHGPGRDRRLPAIEQVIATQAPDVLALQEAWSLDDGTRIAQVLARPRGMHWAQPTGDCVNAILSRWPVVCSHEARLPTCGAGDEGRTVLYALLDHPDGLLPVFTTQLHADPFGSAIRRRQVEAVCRFAAVRRADLPLVVAGDLNAEPGSDEVRLAEGHRTTPPVPGFGLIDAWRFATDGRPGWTWDPRNPHARAACDVGARIDYVFTEALPGPRRVLRVAVAGDRPVGGTWPSDHAAVVADLRP